jgi:putative protease
VATATDLRLLDEPDIARVALSLTPANVKGITETPRLSPELRARIIWDIPAIVFPGDWSDFRGVVGRLRAQGFRAFRLNNLGHLGLFPERVGLELVGGAGLYTMNSQAGLAWRELGLDELTLPLESDRENLATMLSRDLGGPVSLTVYGPLPLLTSRIPLRGTRPGDRIGSDQGEEFRLENDQGLTVLRSGNDFSIIDRLAGLPGANIARLHLDLSHCGPFSARGRSVFQALQTGGAPLAGTTLFNFERGLE